MKTATEFALDLLLEQGGFSPAYPEPFALELAFTDCYRRHAGAGIANRELACLRVLFPSLLQPFQPGDLLAGRIRLPLVGFSPEPAGLGFYCREADIRFAVEQLKLASPKRDAVNRMVEFWRTETTQYKTRAACPSWVNEILPSDDWCSDSGMAFPLYRMAGTQLDYGKLLRLGLPGLRQEAERRRAWAGAEPHAAELFDGMIGALDLAAAACQFYAVQARQGAAAAAGDEQRRLSAMADTLHRISHQPPGTLPEAMQLTWLYALLSGTWNYGRMDVYLGPFLERDLKTGQLDEHEALALVQSLWRLMKAYDNQYNNRVFIGGKGRPDEAAADRFARLAIEATRALRLNEPQLSLRFHRRQNPGLLDLALTAIGEGCTFPMLYNDDVNIPAVQEAFGVSEAEATAYTPFGCGEFMLEHRSVGSPNSVINLLKCLEVALHNGRDPVPGRPAGPATGEAASFREFEDLWRAYAAQVERCVAACAVQQKVEYDVTAQAAPFLLLSLLYDDCLARGRGVFDGGARHLGGTLETYGNTNTADSLVAIEELVFRRRQVTLPELVAACDANFAGRDALRGELLAAAKYGNDDPVADAMAARVHEHVCNCTRQQAVQAGLDSYLVVIINNWANVILGRRTGASADGRGSGEPMANGNNPSPGMDRQGTTAFLNSLVRLRPNLHAGAVQNMKFGRSLFGTHRPKLAAMLQTYFDLGGTQAMITVVNRGDLEAAMREPEKWAHLMVRVGGFSARFIDLPRDAQLEVLARMLHE